MMKDFKSNIIGRYAHAVNAAEPFEDAAVFLDVLSRATGPYLEIGVLWGASMILAGTVMPDADLHGIDPLVGYGASEGRHDPEVATSPSLPTIESVYQNLINYGMRERATIYQQFHPPMPGELQNTTFGAVFIDGDHYREAVRKDWDVVKHQLYGPVIFHDLHSNGVMWIFEEVVGTDPAWTIVHKGGPKGYSTMGVAVPNQLVPEYY